MAGELEITLSKGVGSLQGDHCLPPGPSIPFTGIKQGCVIRRGFPVGSFVPFLGPSRYSSRCQVYTNLQGGSLQCDLLAKCVEVL